MQKFFLFFLMIGSFSTVAKKFETSYVSFDLLNNWACRNEGTEWICANKLNRKKASEAVIILTGKQKGPTDSLAQYMKYLKNPRVVKARGGKGFTSKVFHTKQRLINKHTWVDGFHQGSEVPVYYTRYLVTVKGNLAVLVTYSAHKNHYKKYAADFASSINSLRVMNVSGVGLGRKGSMGVGNIQDHLQDMIDADQELGGWSEDESGGGKGGGLSGLLSPEGLAGLGLGGSGLGYWLYRRRKKRRASPSERDVEDERDRRPRRRRSSRSSREGLRSSARSSSRRRR